MKHPTEEHLQAYIDRQLSVEDAETVRAHLRACVRCRKVLHGYHAIFELLRAEPRWQFSDRFEARVMRKIAKEPLGELFNKLWSALVIFGILIGALGVALSYTNTQTYVDAVRNISLPSFKITPEVLKPFNFLPDVGSFLKSGKPNIQFLLLCIVVLVVIAVVDQAVQFAKSRSQNGV